MGASLHHSQVPYGGLCAGMERLGSGAIPERLAAYSEDAASYDGYDGRLV